MTTWRRATHPVLGQSFRRTGSAPPRCPGCGTALNASAPFNGSKAPKDGELSLCAHCGAVAEFCDGGFRAVDESTLPEETRAVLAKARAHVASITGRN